MAAAAARAATRAPAMRSAAARFSAQSNPAASPFRSTQNPLSSRILRSSVVMGVSVESLLPLHTAIASSRMISMLDPSPSPSGWLLRCMMDGNPYL